jgi:hypothetical protein
MPSRFSKSALAMKSCKRGVGQLAAEVDHAVADDRAPGLPAIVQK